MEKKESSASPGQTNQRNSCSPLPNLSDVGEKKGWDPLEEFWMQKLRKVEEQYEEHMTKLEKKLLETRANRRVIAKQDEDLHHLKKHLKEKCKESEHLQRKAGQLQQHLKLHESTNHKLQEKLQEVTARFNTADQDSRRGHYELKKCSKQICLLKKRLKRLERDNKALTGDVQIHECERLMQKDKESHSWQEKVQIIRSIRSLSTDKQLQEIEKLKLQKQVGLAIKDAADQDKRLLSLRKELEQVSKTMVAQREAHEHLLSEKRKSDRKLETSEEKVEYAKSKLDTLQAQILSWKQEMNYKEVHQVRQRSELLKAKSENRRLRSQLAELTQKTSRLNNDIKAYEMERERVKTELRKVRTQDEAIQKLLRENAFQRLKLTQKLPPIHLAPTQQVEYDRLRPKTTPNAKPDATPKEIEGYKKKIWELERKLAGVERKISDSQRKENVYRVKLQNCSAIKEQLFWTQRAMQRLEFDRQGMEQMIQTFAKTIPRKMPLEKLVTDPSILDRISKQRVLQQRLLEKSAQVEQMKETINWLIEREEKRRAEAIARPLKQSQPWQIHHWRNQKEKSTPPPATEPGGSLSTIKSEINAGYYKDYVGFLQQEIPRIKDELLVLERKKQFLRAMGKSSQSRSTSTSVVDLHADEVIGQSPPPESEEEESDEYEDDDEEYGNEEDYDEQTGAGNDFGDQD